MACLLLVRCWCYTAEKSLSGGVEKLYLNFFGKSELAVINCTSLCAIWVPVDLLRSCCPPA